MRAGSRVIVPEGFLNLSKGVTYHFLISDGQRNRVRMVEFRETDRKIVADLLELASSILRRRLRTAGLSRVAPLSQRHLGSPINKVWPSHTWKNKGFPKRRAMSRW